MGFQPEVFWSFHTATSEVPAHSRYSGVFKSHRLFKKTNNEVKLKGEANLLNNSLTQPFICSTDSIGHLLESGPVLGTVVPALMARASPELSLLWANPAIWSRAQATGEASKGMQVSKSVQVPPSEAFTSTALVPGQCDFPKDCTCLRSQSWKGYRRSSCCLCSFHKQETEVQRSSELRPRPPAN